MIVSPLLLATSAITILSSFTRPTTASPLNGKQDHDGDQHAACNKLWKSAPRHLDSLTVNLAEWVPAGSTLNYTSIGSFIPVAIDVGPFCRFSGNITTSHRSSVRFEVWLPPKEQWNGVSGVDNSDAVQYGTADSVVDLGWRSTISWSGTAAPTASSGTMSCKSPSTSTVSPWPRQ
jgi:hypothetical protein